MMITGTVLYNTELAFLLSPLTALRALLASASRATCVYVVSLVGTYCTAGTAVHMLQMLLTSVRSTLLLLPHFTR
jgi:hypothetical protein